MKYQRTMEDEMQGKLPIGSHFFKVLIPGFKQALRLPPLVSRILNNGEIPEAAILVSRRGSWRVGVGQCSNGLTFNGKGWDGFVQDHDLNVGDFLVFEHTGDMHFSTLVLDSTSCEKEFPMTSENVEDKGPDDDHSHNAAKGIERKQDEATTSYQHKDSLFQIKLQRYSVAHKSPVLFIPLAFVESNELSDKTTATLVNPSGHTWEVHLKRWRVNPVPKSHSNERRYRQVMATGWSNFVKENDLKVGDVCVFKLNHSLEGSKNAVMNVQFFSM